ncbi:MAG: pallilysin-related adhesin [Treponema sp.]|nr:pallilysin-related adhesin [Treponema sp.]
MNNGMKKIIPVIFVLIAAALAVVYFSRRTLSNSIKDDAPSLVTADSQEKKSSSDENSVTIVEENTPTSFMPLKDDETLLSSMGIDIDGDKLDDEILIVRKLSGPNLVIVIGLYNQAQKMYVRAAEIKTEISQFRSFSYNVMDVTGDHEVALVYQGFLENGNSVLQIFDFNRSGDSLSLNRIGDFKSDGTIFIEQYARTDTYELNESSGKSFPVWVYSSDPKAGAGSLNQLQTQYDWNPSAGRYTQTKQILVTGRNLAVKELAKIQDGTVETFAAYLKGLWVQYGNEDRRRRYIYIDYDNREVIFLENDGQEVYNWVSSSLYRNGIYIQSANSSIENLHRRFAVTLTDIDRVRIQAYDDVRMHIGADNLWNGYYKRLTDLSAFTKTASNTKKLDALQESLNSDSGWYTADGAGFVFKNGVYTVTTENFTENGSMSIYQVDNTQVIQFSSADQQRYLGDVYIIDYKQIPRVIRYRNGRTKTVYDDETSTIVLRPAVLMASSVQEISGKVITLNSEKK